MTIDWRDKLMAKALSMFKMLNLDKILNKVPVTTYSFTDFFKGFEKVEVVRRIFNEKTEEVLQNLKIEFTWIGGYMWVNASTGHLMINSRYIKNGDKMDIYLDLIHELVHIRQLMEGKELFDGNYSYIERPTEVEAYCYAVEEAKRLGLSDKRICKYLKTEWMSEKDLKQLAKNMNIDC